MAQEAKRSTDGNWMYPAGTALVVVGLLLAFAGIPRVLAGGHGRLSGADAPDFTAELVLNPETVAAALPAPEAGAVAPKTVTLSELRGKAVVLDFWATWCGPCKAEAPIMDGIAKRYKDRGVVVVGVNTDDEEGNAEEFARQRHLSFPIAFDRDRSAARAYGVSALPTLVVVSRTGKIVAVRTGVTSDTELEELIREALAS
ncbi:MAG: redoxin family protein [Polyangiaceae bacterium]|nr:redoxin family protein [Polyangiaceae bacterium]